MLVNIENVDAVRATHKQRAFALGIALLLFIFLAVTVYWGAFGDFGELPGVAEAGGHTEALGWKLFLDYLLPFEIISVLLLIAMIGAIVLARKEPGEEEAARK
jgi:NADH-quinone oxidoreductase subunit J